LSVKKKDDSVTQQDISLPKAKPKQPRTLQKSMTNRDGLGV